MRKVPGTFRIAAAVVEGFGPGVLIEGLNRRAVRSQDEAQAEADDQLRVRQVGNDLGNRPFILAGRRASVVSCSFL